ncbi:MAG: MFS transporter [Mailhella sp.]|nr:MFS transporter [Mailhella sp.]
MGFSAAFPRLMSVGHFTVDINQGALVSILPFLIAAYGYDYATAGTLILAYNLVGSIVQPLFGQIADRRYTGWMLPFAAVLACGGMAASGFCSSFPLLCLAVMAGGVGVSMMHPVAALVVNRSADAARHGWALSSFSFGGSLGFALGPVVMSTSVELVGMAGTLVILIPAAVLCALVIPRLGELAELMRTTGGSARKTLSGKDDWKAFSRLCCTVFTRSVIYHGLNTFVALFWVYELGRSKAAGSATLSLFFFSACAGTLLGGRLADRFGYRNVLRGSHLLMVPLLCMLSVTRDVVWATLLLVPLGLVMNMGYSSMVVLGQRYLPNRMGLASGITLGVSVTIGGVAVPLLGRAADMFGLSVVFPILTGLGVFAALGTLFLVPLEEEAADGRRTR